MQVVIYTDWAKCVLMENGPNAHFDACFYDGEPCILPQCTHKLAPFIQINTSILCTMYVCKLYYSLFCKKFAQAEVCTVMVLYVQ